MEKPNLNVNIQQETELMFMKKKKEELLLEISSEQNYAKNHVNELLIRHLSEEIALAEWAINQNKSTFVDAMEKYNKENSRRY